MQAFVPKNRRPRFQLNLKIIDLNNVPLVSGTSLVKWDLPHSSAAEHRGRTSKCYIKDHKVTYDYEKSVPLKLTVDKNGMLQEANIRFEVLQEYSSGTRGERISLGNVKINLAEYVDASESIGEDDEDGICRRYLMQDSKINSTLKIGIYMKLLDNERSFEAPPLKSAPVFGGIAGIMAGEQGEADDVGHMPTLSNKSRDAGDAQDMYRRNLAAYWTAQPGELRADECIEDIFAGGDGWGSKGEPKNKSPRKKAFQRDSRDEDRDWTAATQNKGYHERHNSRETIRKGSDGSPLFGDHRGSKSEDSIYTSTGVGGRGSLEQHANHMKAEAASRPSSMSHDVDEFDIREDLRSWKLPESVS